MKAVIAESFNSLVRQRGIDKVTVKAVIEDCGISRQTFYYHFQDKYELLSWIYYNENFAAIAEDISLLNWNIKIYELLNNIKQEKSFYMNTIKEQEHTFESYLYEMTKALFSEAIEVLDEKGKLTEEERDFDAGFYAYGLCGVIMDWVRDGMKMEPKEVSDRLKSLARATERIGYIRSQAEL